MAAPRTLNTVIEALRGAATALASLDLRFALIGGIAVSVRGQPRFTNDVDLAVAVESDFEAEELVARLQRRGYRVHAVLEQRKTGRLATVRLVTGPEPEGPVLVDLLFASSGIEREVVAAARPIQLMPGLKLRVAQAGHLIALKALSESPRRLQDRLDLDGLLARANARELRRAREALALIEGRGYARKKDLGLVLARALRRANKRR
jgi:hypothetical protein